MASTRTNPARRRVVGSAQTRSRAQSPLGRGRPWLVLIGALGTLLLLAWAYVLFSRGDGPVEGVRLLGQPLTAPDPLSLQRDLEQRFQAYSETRLSLRYADGSLPIAPLDTGLRYDAEQTARNALAVGRQGHLLQQAWDTLIARWRGWDVPLASQFDAGRHAQLLDGLAAQVERDRVDAGLKVEDGKLVITPARSERRLDRNLVSAALLDHVRRLNSEPIPLPIKEQAPRWQESDLAEARTQAEQLIAAPLRLVYTDVSYTWDGQLQPKRREQSWTVSRDELAALLGVREDSGPGGKSRAAAAIDANKATLWARKLSAEVNQEPKNARAEWRNGRLVPLTMSQERRVLDVAELARRLDAAARGDRRVELPVVSQRAPVDVQDMDHWGIRESIYERSLSYSFSVPARAHNIELGASRLHGVVVPPGGVFSFNEAVGEVSERSGYQLGYAIVGDGYGLDFGGGICQVATTLYQAVFFSGLEIVDRTAHTFRLPSYEPPVGVDAAVDAPSNLDFKFRNNTGNSILIQAGTSGGNVKVALYSSRPNWTVQVDNPVLTNEKPNGGVDVSVTRTVSEPGQAPRRSTFVSHYVKRELPASN